MYSTLIKKLNTFNEGLVKLEKWISFVLFSILIFMLIAQVIFRFILKLPAPWTEELARYSFIYMMWFSCGVTLHYGKHIDMNLLDSFLVKFKSPEKAFFVMSKVTMIANMFFCGYFISMYYPFLMKLAGNHKYAITVHVPMVVFQSSVLVGFILMFWHSFVLFLQPYGVAEEVKEGGEK